MVLSLFLTEKTVKKYISDGLWLNCNLSEFYTYLEYHDEGGYGSVHKVLDRLTGDYLILKRASKKDFVSGSLNHKITKLLPSDKSMIIDTSIKISKEAEFMVKVDQKLGNIKLYDYYDDDDHYILLMEYGGRSLESIVCPHKKKILELLRYDAYRTNMFYHNYLKQVIKYMVEVYHKIKDIHDLGIHHNDLKPENILILKDKITIIDFGVSKTVKNSYEGFSGTIEYVPYEYVKYGTYKPWDHTIWCFGIMLYFLTLMKYPFKKEEDVLNYNLNFTKLSKLPNSFSNLIIDCLQKDPSNRPQNLLERLNKLESYKF